MSAPAINPAPSPTPGAASTAGGPQGHGVAAHGHAAQNPLAAFEAMLETLFGAQATPAVDPAAAGVLAKAGGKAGAGKAGDSKTGLDATTAATDGKPATDPDGKASDAATATVAITPNPNLALLVPAASNLPAAAQAGADGEATATQAQPDAGGKPPGLSVALDKLNQLAANGVETGAAKTAVQAAATAAAERAGAEASATADALTPKPAGTATPQPAAPQTPAPSQAAPTPAAVAVATAASATVSQAAPSTLPAQAQAPAAPRDAGLKDKVAAAKPGTRVDLIKLQAAPGATAALTAKAAEALQPLADGGPKAGPGDGDPEAPAIETAAVDADDAPQAPLNPATAPATAPPAALIHAAALAVRGAPQTVANLAAQIVKKLDGRATQFDIQLDPAGLGKVDVRVAIGADGRMSAAMSFDTPQAAAELKSRSAELQLAMEQAGFDLSGGMSFDVASDQGGQAQNQPQADLGAQFRGRAFQAALDTTADAGPPPQLQFRRTARAGVDIRI